MRYFLMLAFFFCSVFLLFAQDRMGELHGKVSFVTAQNIYVRFEKTASVELGDTIFIRQDDKLNPLFLVESKSSLSCMGKPLGTSKVSVGEPVFGRLSAKSAIEEKEDLSRVKEEPPMPKEYIPEKAVQPEPDKSIFKQDIKGRISASSYSSFSGGNTSNDSHRLRYNLSLQASNISDSRFSVDAYLSFTHQLNDWAAVPNDIFNALKIYSLALRFQMGEQSSVWLGRKINPNLSNIGAIDGVFYETGVKNFHMGAVVGFRPDYQNYSINTDLLEYGAYLSHQITNETGVLQNSVAFFQQQYQGKTDRRFAYFQHTNSLLKNLSLFVSSELDLYKLENDLPKNTLSLTSFYASLRYRASRQLSLFTSYDARKNVIYYETFKSMVDQLLEEATRQGVQFRVNYRPAKFMSIGANANYRVRDNDARPTQTFNGFLSFPKVPFIKASATLTANLLQTNYLDGMIYGLKFNKDLFNGKLFSSFGYRYVDYKFLNSGTTLNQNIGELDLSWRMSKKMSVSINYEGTFEKSANYNRVYFSLIKRF